MPIAQIIEVGLRDGLQNTLFTLPVEGRYNIVKRLRMAGIKRIELGSFVSPKLLPQMKNTSSLVKKVLCASNQSGPLNGGAYFAFVPNEIGFHRAVDCGLRELSIFLSCTESFSKKNINMDLKASIKNLQLIARNARRLKIKIRGYLSAAFFCPYEGKTSAVKAAALADQMMQEGLFEISISDTIGAAVYSDVIRLMCMVQKRIPVKKIALHFHDTRGTGLANVIAGLQCGVKKFDSSIGGLGGCPYAPGASGNIATEDLNYMLTKMQIITKVNTHKLIDISKMLDKKWHIPLSSHLVHAGLL